MYHISNLELLWFSRHPSANSLMRRVLYNKKRVSYYTIVADASLCICIQYAISILLYIMQVLVVVSIIIVHDMYNLQLCSIQKYTECSLE